MEKVKSIHFVGIKGVGMAPLAIIAKEAGIKVTGSDIGEEFITDEVLQKVGVIPFVGFLKEHVGSVDLVVTTGAHGGFDNEEVLEAKRKGITVLTQGEAVGVFMEGTILGQKDTVGISVAGSHGKTTTTAMIATILKECHQDPSFLVGTANVSSLGSCGHFGTGKYFVAEADEYATEPIYDTTPKLLWQHPKIALFTNIELDHPDLYKSVEEVRAAFLQFANNLPYNGTLVVNGDDGQIKKLCNDYKGTVISFGYSPRNDYVLKRVNISGSQTFFWVETKGTSLGEFVVSVPGEHNALNAVGALVVGIECGFSVEKMKHGLSVFKGSKRRFEFVAKTRSGILLYDDYAHHPTEIKKTLAAFRKSFPKHKIICIFQPHTFSRTKILFDQFLHAFHDAEQVIITDIYPSLREHSDSSISSKQLVEAMGRFHKNVIFLPELSHVVEYTKQKNAGEDTILVTMGAGDIYKIHDQLKRL